MVAFIPMYWRWLVQTGLLVPSTDLLRCGRGSRTCGHQVEVTGPCCWHQRLWRMGCKVSRNLDWASRRPQGQTNCTWHIPWHVSRHC